MSMWAESWMNRNGADEWLCWMCWGSDGEATKRGLGCRALRRGGKVRPEWRSARCQRAGEIWTKAMWWTARETLPAQPWGWPSMVRSFEYFQRGYSGQPLCQVVGMQTWWGNARVVPAAHYTKIKAVIARREKSRMCQENIPWRSWLRAGESAGSETGRDGTPEKHLKWDRKNKEEGGGGGCAGNIALHGTQNRSPDEANSFSTWSSLTITQRLWRSNKFPSPMCQAVRTRLGCSRRSKLFWKYFYFFLSRGYKIMWCILTWLRKVLEKKSLGNTHFLPSTGKRHSLLSLFPLALGLKPIFWTH